MGSVAPYFLSLKQSKIKWALPLQERDVKVDRFLRSQQTHHAMTNIKMMHNFIISAFLHIVKCLCGTVVLKESFISGLKISQSGGSILGSCRLRCISVMGL